VDKRGKKIIYLSQCLLNQNLRFPGIAVESGAISELLIYLINSGIGIEPLPCLERLGWGGVERKTFYKYFPMISKNIGSKMFPIIKLFLRFWLRNFRKLCKKEAKKIVDQMLDYHKSGYSILGIITTNDSPTCGLTKTINLLDLSSKYKELGLKNEFFESPSLEKMKDLIPSICENGTGLFTSELIKENKKRKLDIEIIGFDIWNDSNGDTETLLKKLGLNS
jgi:predicted secreted protein